MRVFLAVTPEPGFAAAAHAWGEAVGASLDPAVRRGLSWVPRERIHLTVCFYGELTPPAVDVLSAALRAPWAVAPFTLAVGGAGTFPPGGRPRVLWLGLSEGAGGLLALRRELHRHTGGDGASDAAEPFSPHLTIARVRRPPPPGIGRTLRAAIDRVPAPRLQTVVDTVTLYQSVPSPAGARYVELLRVPLDGTPGPAA